MAKSRHCWQIWIRSSSLWSWPHSYISNVGTSKRPMIPSNPNFHWRISPEEPRSVSFRFFMPSSTLQALPQFALLRLMRWLPPMTKTQLWDIPENPAKIERNRFLVYSPLKRPNTGRADVGLPMRQHCRSPWICPTWLLSCQKNPSQKAFPYD